jgi:hypothetical protein
MRIALERSRSEIYDRIVLRLAKGFAQAGHTPVLVDPAAITSVPELFLAYDDCDWALISNSAGLLSMHLDDGFLFERVAPKLLFLHHDAPFNSSDLEQIRGKLEAYLRIRERSLHFSIENSDETDLNRLGISCYPITHISTLDEPPRPQPAPPPVRGIAFIGHVVPPIHVPIAFGTELDLNYFQSYLGRLRRMDHPVKADFPIGAVSDNLDTTARKAQYIQYVNTFSLFQRGALLQDLPDYDVHIFGGDPSWIHGVEPSRFLTKNGLAYHPPVFETRAIAEVFAGSRVNLNITSLQFDTAVINRLMDCASCGGFMLTDRKDQLSELTSVAEEVMFATPAELADKLEFFLNPANDSKRREIAGTLAEDIARSCSLEHTIGYMLDQMSRQ